MSILASEGAAALVARLRQSVRARRRTQARAIEAGWLAARAQTWLRTPHMLGGPADAALGFHGLTVDRLGLRLEPSCADVYRTAIGSYRVLAVPACAGLRAAATHLGMEAGAGGGLLVVGMGEAAEEAIAVLALGPLVQIPLDAVPWSLVRILTTPRADPLLLAEMPAAAPVEAPMPRRVAAPDAPQRARRLPSWRSPKPTVRRRNRPATRGLA